MRNEKSQLQATLLDVLIDGFEKNEIMGGFHWRDLPMPDEPSAVVKFRALTEEATRWKGQPARATHEGDRQISAWPDLEIRRIGRGIMVRAAAPWFDRWWHEAATWEGDPFGPIFDWIDEESDGTRR
jgi:hypothetical protein